MRMMLTPSKPHTCIRTKCLCRTRQLFPKLLKKMAIIRSNDLAHFLVYDEGASPEQPDFLETLLDVTEEAVRQASVIPTGITL